MRKRYAVWSTLVLLLAACTAFCREEGEEAGGDAGGRADIEEKLGATLPGELWFTDSEGVRRRLDSLLTRPTILALVYYHCTGQCSVVLDNLAGVLRDLPEKAGTDYTVVAVSFDETDTPETARRKKEGILQAAGPTCPPAGLCFLTGDRDSIQALLDATGFHAIRQGREFVHSTALIVTAAGGKIVRYIHGSQYLPAEVSLALGEAKAGRLGFSVRRLASVCFSEDPKGRGRGLAVLRVGGLALAVGLLIVMGLMLSGGRKKGSSAPPPGDAGGGSAGPNHE